MRIADVILQQPQKLKKNLSQMTNFLRFITESEIEDEY